MYVCVCVYNLLIYISVINELKENDLIHIPFFICSLRSNSRKI